MWRRPPARRPWGAARASGPAGNVYITAGMALKWLLATLTWGPGPAMVEGVVGRTKRVAAPGVSPPVAPGHDPTGRPPRSRGRTGRGGEPPPPPPRGRAGLPARCGARGGMGI